MDHRIKAAIQWILSVSPGGSKVNNRLQRVRKMLPESYLDSKVAIAGEILGFHAKHVQPPLAAGRIRSLEIGAGWDLLIPMAMRAHGIGSAHCVDLFRHLDLVRVQQTIERLRRILPGGSLPDWPRSSTELPETVLESLYGIHYEAPCDARRTSFDGGSFDLFLSHNVLEHVQPRDIAALHRESLRILKPGSIAVHYIDLQDHWAYATPKRTVHGFLANGPVAWRFLNPPIHFQNRLRSLEHIRLAKEAGFEIAEAMETPATPEQMEALSKPGAIHPSLAGIGSREEMGVTSLRLILRKPSD